MKGRQLVSGCESFSFLVFLMSEISLFDSISFAFIFQPDADAMFPDPSAAEKNVNAPKRRSLQWFPYPSTILRLPLCFRRGTFMISFFRSATKCIFPPSVTVPS